MAKLSVAIRSFEPEDLDSVLSLYLECCESDPSYLPAVPRTLEGLARWFPEKSPDRMWLAVSDAGQAVGVIGATQRPPPTEVAAGHRGSWAELCRLAVHPSARRVGLAKRLTEQVHWFAESRRLDQLWLRCVEESEAERYYRRLGWSLLAETSFDPPDDVQNARLLWRATPSPGVASRLSTRAEQ